MWRYIGRGGLPRASGGRFGVPGGPFPVEFSFFQAVHRKNEEEKKKAMPCINNGGLPTHHHIQTPPSFIRARVLFRVHPPACRAARAGGAFLPIYMRAPCAGRTGAGLALSPAIKRRVLAVEYWPLSDRLHAACRVPCAPSERGCLIGCKRASCSSSVPGSVYIMKRSVWKVRKKRRKALQTNSY